MAQRDMSAGIYTSGEEVEPGVYRDLQTGSVVIVAQRDELPEGVRLVRYARRFRREGPAPARPADRR